MKRPLILWSGGFDSTALVVQSLMRGDIDILYVDLDNNDRMQKHEKRAIEKLKILLADARLPGRIVSEFNFGYQYIATTKSIYGQPALWLQAAVFTVNPDIHSEIALGYVRYDDIWHYKTEFMNTYQNLINLVCDGQEIVPLKFPLEWQTKEDVLASMKDFVYTQRILNIIYYCEQGTSIPCGECQSCKRHEKELGQVRLMKVDMTDKLVDICHEVVEEPEIV